MATIWDGTELEQYAIEGYNAIALETGCLWATDVAPDYAFAFNYTCSFELGYFVGGDIVSGLAQFTFADERDFIDNATGPANHNFHWEHNQGYTTDAGVTTEISAFVDLPTEFYELERATWNTVRLEAMRSRDFEGTDSRYELSKGPVDAFVQDKDGLRRLRKWRVPSVAYAPFDMDSSSSEFGVLVDISDIDSDTPQGGSWGDFVEVAGEHAMGDPWGIIVAVYSEPNNMRYEYRRRGTGGPDDMELPTRYQVYVRHYAQARALEREGDGQDLDLAAWYDARYQAGVERAKQRKKAMHFQRKYVMGGGTKQVGRLPLARLPWQYGKVVR